MGRKLLKALGGAALATALAFTPANSAEDKFITVHGDPNIILALVTEYQPDGRPNDHIYLINRSKRFYCFRLEIYDDAFIRTDRKVNIMTSPPGSSYLVAYLKILYAGGKYRYKFKGLYLDEAGIEGRDCRKAFPKGVEY